MIEYFVRGTLVLTLALIATRVLRKQTAAFRHLIWIGAFFVAATAPLFMRFGPHIQLVRPAQARAIQSSPIVATNTDVPFSAPMRSAQRIPFLKIFWSAGILVFGIRVWNANRKAGALLKNARFIEHFESVPVVEADASSIPMTIGVIHPVILLPRECRLWAPELLRAVLLHEIAHVRRRDCLVQWLPNIVCAVHWFNPLVWLARSEMLCESERACDDAVIRSGMSGSVFARNLIEIAQSIRLKGDSLMSNALTTKLERRISRLLDSHADRRPLNVVRALFCAVSVIAFLAPIAGVKAERVIKSKHPVGILAQLAQTTPPQAATGSLSGTVTDPTGAVVAGANVRVTLPSNGGSPPVAYSSATNATGQWSFSSLPAGTYTLEIQVPGFKAFNQAISVNPGVNTEVKSNMSLGRLTESVTIAAQRSNTVTPAVQAPGRPLRVGGMVQAAKKIRDVVPVYPQSARDRGIQGSVTFNAIVDKAGYILDTQLVTRDAPPDLVQAALDAVKQWQYQPTLLNGEPVDVLTEITLNFQLH